MFEKWILKRAKKISEKTEKFQEEKKANEEAVRNRNKEIVQKASNILYEYVNNVATKMIDDYRAVKEGDRAILNIYQLIFDNYPNSWDGGANVLLTHTPEADKTTPMFVTIKKVSPEKSQVYDRIDRFLYQREASYLEDLMNSNALIQTFKNQFLKSDGTKVKDEKNLGMYFSATFETETSFHPVWTLSTSSFLKVGTPEADLTEEIWKEELTIKAEYAKLNERSKELNERSKQINEKYRGIRVII